MPRSRRHRPRKENIYEVEKVVKIINLGSSSPRASLSLNKKASSPKQKKSPGEALCKTKDDKETIRIRMVIKKLVEANVFRYDKEGRLRFHNRVIEGHIKGDPLWL